MNAFVWLIVLPVVAAPPIYVAGHLRRGVGARRCLGARRGNAPRMIALGALLAAWIPFALAARDLAASGATTFALGSIALRFDGLSLLVSALALGLGTLVVIYSGASLSGEAGEEKYYAMLVVLVGVLIGLGAANDLFNLWIWFEAMALASYLLVAFYREERASLEAGVKYLAQSATGSVLVLLGIALVLAQTGTLDLNQIRAAVQVNHPSTALRTGAGLPLLAASALFVIGFGVKAALVPLHTWLPDAHAQAPSGISAMLSGIVIEAGLIAMLRALSPLLSGQGAEVRLGEILLALGAVNMLVGNLLALRQTQVKRLLAFSSIAQVGYILLGLGISLSDGQVGGAQGAFFQLFNHGLMKGLAFLAAGALLYALHSGMGNHAPLTIGDLSGAARRYPVVAMAFSIAVLGLGGLPPLAGFMSKWQIFVAGFQTNNVWIDALVVFAALNSVLSLAYYAPLVNALYREQPSPVVQAGRTVTLTTTAPLALIALIIVVIGIWPTLLNWITQPAGAALMALGG